RPFGDNGSLAENWSVNLLHLYEGNTSLLGDCLKIAISCVPRAKGCRCYWLRAQSCTGQLGAAHTFFRGDRKRGIIHSAGQKGVSNPDRFGPPGTSAVDRDGLERRLAL